MVKITTHNNKIRVDQSWGAVTLMWQFGKL